MALSKPSTSKSNKDRPRTFQEDWEMKYLFAETKTLKPICLICSTTVAIVKKYNLERHFKQNHSKFNQDYPEGSVLRTDFVNRKKRELCCQQNLFKKQSKEVESMVKASYKISLLLARKKKPFSDGEIVKEALSIFAQHCEDQNVKVSHFQEILLQDEWKTCPLISATKFKIL
uniref:General transcription factor II-I repeat domain-containing protein 2 n=1 Tax=Cacopsylla melanoneura TaxID=428564 RepID=A0A8D9B4P7_9HEMI